MEKAELTKLLHKKYHRLFKKAFADNGFKRFKSNSYIRITEDDIIQMVNIQKHSYATRFTYNICTFPLFIKSDFMYFAFGGIRAGKFKDGCDFWWNYSAESEIDSSLLGSLELFASSIFPFFDAPNSTSKLLEHLYSPCCLFEEYKYQAQNHSNNIGLLLLQKGDRENAYRLLKPEVIGNIKLYDTEYECLNSVIQENYKKFGIDKNKYATVPK